MFSVFHNFEYSQRGLGYAFIKKFKILRKIKVFPITRNLKLLNSISPSKTIINPPPPTPPEESTKLKLEITSINVSLKNLAQLLFKFHLKTNFFEVNHSF